jgi:DegV family protein with EDD domain
MIKVVTDSTCDLPPDLVQRHDIRVIPMTITIEDHAYYDGVDITREEYYARLPQLKVLPTTAASSAGEFETVYRQCGDAEIVSLHIALGLSSIINVARLAAKASRQRVTLIDSHSVSMGLGWQVVAAAEAAEAGGTLADILAVVASVQKRVHFYALLDTLEYLRRGGRANAMVAAVSDFLQIKPLIQVADGQVSSLTRLRTHSRGMDELVKSVEQFAPLERLAVVHTNSLAEARRLAERVAHCLLPTASPAVITDATVIVGTHAGPGAVGFAVVSAA